MNTRHIYFSLPQSCYENKIFADIIRVHKEILEFYCSIKMIYEDRQMIQSGRLEYQKQIFKNIPRE